MGKKGYAGLVLVVTLLTACVSPPDSAPTIIPAITAQHQGYPPPPVPLATATHPAGYPAPTIAPTFDATRSEITAQAIISASTATTAALLATRVAQGTPLPPSPGGPADTPAPMPTRLLIYTKPDCESRTDYVQCHDVTLGLTFEYPLAWGQITAQFFTGETGAGYEYKFSGTTPGLFAGGRSRDFGEGRDWFYTDFGGWDAGPRPEAHLVYGEIISNVLQTNVTLVSLFPESSAVCDPGLGVISSPLGLLQIDLPANDTITGFLFAVPILSDELESELASVLGIGDPSPNTQCLDSDLRQQYDAKVEEIVEAIRAGTVEPATQAKLDQLLHLAQSLRFD